MAKTVVALFDDLATAQRAVQSLLDSGFNSSDIALVSSNSRGEFNQYFNQQGQFTGTPTARSGAASGVAEGAGIGAVVGGLAGLGIGLAMALIPGVGPVLAVGWLASGLAGAGMGAGVGAAAGGIIGTLTGAGVPKEQAGLYAEGVRRGGTLVAVRAPDERANDASMTLKRFSPVDIERRSGDWRKEGWKGFDETGQPYTTTTTGYGETTGRMMTGQTAMAGGDFDTYEPEFRNHYQATYSNTGYGFDQLRPAYKFGYNMGREDRFQGQNWNQAEPMLKREFQQDFPNQSWDTFRDAVYQGWETAQNR